MITTMRGRFKNKKYQPIIWIALISMLGAASLPELLKRLFGAGDWIAQVNGIQVTQQQFLQKVEEEKQYIEMIKKQFGPYAATLFAGSGLNLDPKDLALKALINEILLAGATKKLNVQIDPEYIKQELLKRVPKEVLETYGTIDLNLLSQLFGYSNVNDFKANIETAIKNNLAIDLLQAALYIPEFELKNYYINNYSKKKFSILVFPLEKYINKVSGNPISNQELKTFFDQQVKNNKQYWTAEKRQGVKWEFPMESYSIKVSDSDLLQYYNKHKITEFVDTPAQIQVRRILLTYKNDKEKTEATKLANNIRGQLQQDKNKFDELAKKYSKDSTSASSGGIMDFFAKGQKEPIFENEAFALKRVGDFSDAFETKSGLEIIQLIKKKAVTFKKFDDIKAKISNIVQKENFAKQFNADVRKYLNNPKDFEEFAKNKGALVSDIPLLVNSDSKLNQKLFSIKNESELASFVNDNKGYVVKLTKLQKSYIPELETIKTKVQQDLYNKKAKETLNNDVQKASELSKTSSMQQLKDQFGANLKTTNWIGIDQSDELQKLSKEHIPVQQLLAINHEDSVEKYIDDKSGYLFKLEHVEAFNADEYAKKKEAIEKELIARRKQELEAGFIASLRKVAKIKVNDKELKQIRSSR